MNFNILLRKIFFILNICVILALELIIFIWPYQNEHYGIPFPNSGLDLTGVLLLIILGLLLFFINRIELFIYKKSRVMFFIVLVTDVFLLYKIFSLFLAYKEYAIYLLH